MDAETARRLVCDTGRRLRDSCLVLGTWGNVSCRIDEYRMAITPSGMDYESLTPEQIPIVDFRSDELTWEGSHEPSAERKLHAAIYRERKDVNAIVHVHSPYASTVAAARREVPPILDDMVQVIGPSVRVAEYALPATKKIVKTTLRALKGRNAALMANHGAVCLGRDMEEAFTCALVLERSCKSFIEAEFLGGAKTIGRVDAMIMRQYYLRKYSKRRITDSTEGPDADVP